MNRIAADEPDEVGILPQPITFWFHGKQFAAAVSKTGLGDRLVRQHGVVYHLRGDFGRHWLADPCTMILEESLQNARLDESRAQTQARAERRQARAAMAEEEASARRSKTARW